VVLALALASCGGADPAERQVSIGRLAADPSPRNRRALRALARDVDRDVRASALHALLALDPPDASRLAGEALGDPDGLVRVTAIRWIADRRAGEWAGALGDLLRADPDASVRLGAAEACGAFAGADGVAALVDALADSADLVRRAAVTSLGRRAPAEAAAGLARLLAEDPVWEVRAAAAAALRGSPDLTAEPALHAALEDPNEFVRAAAASALRERAAGAASARGKAS